MRYLEGEKVAQVLSGIISAKKQQHDYETDLTAGRILRVTGGGAVDFGGSEERVAEREELQPRKESPDDKHGWWNLAEGSYIVELNERPVLSKNQIGFLQPHERLVRAGATHPSFYFRAERERLETMIVVGTGGVRIKENARISKFLLLQLDTGDD